VCAEVSRDLSAELDVADIIEHRYTLEVSSPGLDRPLKSARDFRRFLGRRAKLKTREPFGGRRSFTGRIAAVPDDATVAIEIEDGTTHTIPIPAIAKANLKIEI
jgi:ribosome maturation factor RimP